MSIAGPGGCMADRMTKLVAFLMVVVPALASADKDLQKSGAWDCKKDPVAHIGNGAGKYTFKGACSKISVGGGENKITIESVEVLEVGGAENTITVGTVGTIDVGGTENTITWKKAKIGDKPKLKGQPDMNKISQKK
jgi:hypothetical protein